MMTPTPNHMDPLRAEDLEMQDLEEPVMDQGWGQWPRSRQTARAEERQQTEQGRPKSALEWGSNLWPPPGLALVLIYDMA